MRGLLLGATLVATLATGMGGVPGAVAARDTSATMTAAGGTQRGHMVTRRTSARHGDVCAVGYLDGTASRDDTVAHDGSGLRWRIPDRRKPTVRLTLAGDLPVDVSGRSRRLPATVTPERSRGRVVAWTVSTPDVGYGDLRLMLDIRWPGACGDDDAVYYFRARSLPVVVP